MELSSQIKKYRTNMNLSQEQLAEKVYVTRQTISNWENDKSYPDIHSLILLSTLFQISLDQLIKGDVTIMKEVINKDNIKHFYREGKIFTALMILFILSFVPLYAFLDIYGFIISGMIFIATMYYAIRIERIKKKNDVQSYKEIVAFLDGKRLDEIEKQQEIAKRPYQKVLLALGAGAITLVVCLIMGLIFS